MTFGENLKTLRTKANLTQDDVANILHVSRQSVSKWEQDISLPIIIYIVPLTKILKCTLDDLFKVYR